MPESTVCHVRQLAIDNIAWTPIAASMLLSRVAVQFAVNESISFRSDSTDPTTEMQIPEGKEEAFVWPHTGHRPAAGVVIGWVKSAASVGNLIIKETT